LCWGVGLKCPQKKRLENFSLTTGNLRFFDTEKVMIELQTTFLKSDWEKLVREVEGGETGELLAREKGERSLPTPERVRAEGSIASCSQEYVAQRKAN